MPKLGVNIDHVATLREVRGGLEPDPIRAALLCEKSGADSIVAHLREDRRHIKEKDLFGLIKVIKTHLNLEMSIASEIVDIALQVKPYQATLVPERRKELTTEGGLDVVLSFKKIKKALGTLKMSGIQVSLFINPELNQIDASLDAGAHIIELHTGNYANAKAISKQRAELERIKEATEYAIKKGFTVNAGHGLNYKNVKPIVRIEGINELNIGHSIVSYAVFVGIFEAVSKMRELIK